MYSRDSCFFSKISSSSFLLPITKFNNGVFLVSHDVLAISRLFSSRIYKAARFFLVRECSSEREIVEYSKKALFCGDCCDRNQAIILVVLVLVSP